MDICLICYDHQQLLQTDKLRFASKLVILDALSNLLEHLLKLFRRVPVDEANIRDAASALELVPGAIDHVARLALDHAEVGQVCAEVALMGILSHLFSIFEQTHSTVVFQSLLVYSLVYNLTAFPVRLHKHLWADLGLE